MLHALPPASPDMPDVNEFGPQHYPSRRQPSTLPFFACAIPLILFAMLAATSCARISDREGERWPVRPTIEASGFATVLKAPPVPYADAPPPSDRERMNTATAMAMELHANPPEDARQAAMALARELQAQEGRNYIGVRVIRDPAPRFAFQFQTDAVATLARYTDDPRFAAIDGGRPAAELQPLADEWNARFAPHRLGVGNVYEFDGVVRFDLQVDEATFRSIARAEGWRLPAQIELVFTPPPNADALDPALAPLVRLVPRHDRVPAVTTLALHSGRVILRDGCFRLAAQEGGGEEALVIFDRDIALVRDDAGYLALQAPDTDQPLPRIGERMTWAGPRGVDERDAGVQALRSACGEGTIVSVGTPSSAHHSRVRPWVIDNLAHDRGMTRKQAWDALKRCWALIDDAGSDARFSRSESEHCRVPPDYL